MRIQFIFKVGFGGLTRLLLHEGDVSLLHGLLVVKTFFKNFIEHSGCAPARIVFASRARSHLILYLIIQFVGHVRQLEVQILLLLLVANR